DPARNALLCALVESAAGQPPPQTAEPAVPRAWIGEAVAITGPTAAGFAKRAGGNLLGVGGDSEAGRGVLANAPVALLAGGWAAPGASIAGAPRFFLLAGDSESANQKRWGAFARLFPKELVVAGPDDAAKIMAEAAADVRRRQAERGTAAQIFLVIDDLSRFR